MNLLENINEIGNKISNDLNLKNIQENFLKSNIGQIVNTTVDMGLKTLLPDVIEDEVIEVKNALITGGLKEGISSAIENTIEVGKKILGIENNSFKSVEEAEKTFEKGDLINNISNVIDFTINSLSNSSILPKNISELLKNGKDAVLNNIDTNVENEFVNEKKALDKIEKYINNWEKCYSKKDLEGLNKEYNKIEKQMKKILPLENILKNVNKIRNINELIKNNDKFDFDELYLNLAENL